MSNVIRLPQVPSLSWDDCKLLVDSVEDYAIFMLDLHGYVATWNRGAQRLKGYLADEIVGQHFARFYLPEDQADEKPARLLAEARELGRVEDEGHRVRKDGSLFWASVVITALRDESGSLRGFAKVTRDLTDRREADEELRRSEERLRLLIESVSDYAIYMLDPTGHVSSWNEGAQRIKGYRPDEILGKHLSVFFPPEAIYAAKPQRELEAARQHGRFEEEGWRIRRDGSRFWANVIITPIRDAQQNLLGFAKVTRDLTERVASDEARRKLDSERAARRAAESTEFELRKAHAMAQEATRKAQEASRMKDEFLSIVSHELRTPLNAMLGWASILREGASDPRAQRGLEVIHRNALAQAKLIDDMLDMARVISGKIELDKVRLDMTALVREAIESVLPATRARQQTVTLEGGDAALFTVADSLRMQQVVWNLLSNASKFSPNGTTIAVALSADAHALRIEVRDQGPGIAPDFAPSLFEPFKQAETKSNRKHGGLGLGLSIVKHIVVMHGGDVSAENGPTGGSIFRVQVPREDAPPSEPMTLPRAAEAASLLGLRVLLVDDSRDALDVLREGLEQAGCVVETVDSAPMALAAIERARPDVLVSDLGMPGHDGLWLIESLRARSETRRLPAIALSAYTQPSDRVRALSAGFDEQLGKPVRLEALLSLLGHLAGRVHSPT